MFFIAVVNFFTLFCIFVELQRNGIFSSKYMKKKTTQSYVDTSVVYKQLTFSRGNVLSYGFDVSRPLGRVSSNKLCQAVKRFAISVPRASKP